MSVALALSTSEGLRDEMRARECRVCGREAVPDGVRGQKVECERISGHGDQGVDAKSTGYAIDDRPGREYDGESRV
jgi:hypothetical protein